MASKRHTSKRVASMAGKLLKDPNACKDVKSVAGSALAQTKPRKKK